MEDLLSRCRAVLATTPARWASLVGALPIDLLNRPAALGEWPALDCLNHLLDTEQHVFPARVRAFLAGQDFPAFNPDTEATSRAELSPAQMAEEFARLRAGSLVLLDTLAPDDLSRAARHAELGAATLGEMLNEWAAHDLMHTVQAERALMQPFIAGTGPWRIYFTDHDLGEPGTG